MRPGQSWIYLALSVVYDFVRRVGYEATVWHSELTLLNFAFNAVLELCRNPFLLCLWAPVSGGKAARGWGRKGYIPSRLLTVLPASLQQRSSVLEARLADLQTFPPPAQNQPQRYQHWPFLRDGSPSTSMPSALEHTSPFTVLPFSTWLSSHRLWWERGISCDHPNGDAYPECGMLYQPTHREEQVHWYVIGNRQFCIQAKQIHKTPKKFKQTSVLDPMSPTSLELTSLLQLSFMAQQGKGERSNSPCQSSPLKK